MKASANVYTRYNRKLDLTDIFLASGKDLYLIGSHEGKPYARSLNHIRNETLRQLFYKGGC